MTRTVLESAGWNPAGEGSSVSAGLTNHGPGSESLREVMEAAVRTDHWERAITAVERNRGAAGPDGMQAHELRAHLERHGGAIRTKLLAGTYVPGAARRVEIPKGRGGTRGLNIPNVVDRFVQQLLLQALTPHLDPRMHASSFGFRPGRSAHDAVRQAQAYAREGYDWVVDMDIVAFFDQVNHDVLMHRLGRETRDKRCLKLIGRMLRAGHILPDGDVARAQRGTPQGGPLSPLLANLYLDELDRELDRRGLKFCRYADDCNVYVRSEAAAARVLASLSTWIGKHLKLEVHPEKSGTGRVWQRKFLGFTLTPALLIAVSGAAMDRYLDRVREHFTGRHSVTSTELRDDWRDYVQGWAGYFGIAEAPHDMARLSRLTRRHIRKCFWQRWHDSKGRYRRAIQLGASPALAGAARSGRGAWRMAATGLMHAILGNHRLRTYGFLVPTDLIPRR